MLGKILAAGAIVWALQRAASASEEAPASDNVLTLRTDAGWSAYARLHPALASPFDPAAWSDWLDADTIAALQATQAGTGLPAALFASVAYGESGGNRNAVGDGGQALGLIQTHRPWREFWAKRLVGGNVRTYAGAQAGSCPGCVAGWVDDPRGDALVSFAALAESVAVLLEKLGAGAPAWVAGATPFDMLVAVTENHRYPGKVTPALAAGNWPYELSQKRQNIITAALARRP